MEEEIGKITHYFSRISVGVLELSRSELRIGDTIHIKGHTTDFYQKVNSIQMDNIPMETVKPKQQVGLKVEYPVRENDLVFKVTDE